MGRLVLSAHQTLLLYAVCFTTYLLNLSAITITSCSLFLSLVVWLQARPLYLSIAITSTLVGFQVYIRHEDAWHDLELALLICGMALQFLSFSSILFWPINNLPPPTGKHKVATFLDAWTVEETLPENWLDPSGPTKRVPVCPFSRTHSSSRRLWMRGWYPSAARLRPANSRYYFFNFLPESKESLAERLAGSFGNVPPYFLSHIQATRTNSSFGGRLAARNEAYPVIIFSHGQGTTPEINSATCEELASHGFVVGAVYHSDWDKTRPGPVARRQADVRHAIDRFVRYNTDPDTRIGVDIGHRKLRIDKGIFYKHLLLDRGVGLVGHSFGGLTSLLACSSESKVNAGAGPKVLCGASLDGWLGPLPPDALQSGALRLNTCFMMVNSQLWLGKPADREKITSLQRRSTGGLYTVTVKGAFHQNFTDVPTVVGSAFAGRILLPSAWMTESDGLIPLLGPKIDARRTGAVVRGLLAKYFKRHLKKRVRGGSVAQLAATTPDASLFLDFPSTLIDFTCTEPGK